MKQRLKIACHPKVIGTATRFALIVGPVLVMINHGDSIINHTMGNEDWLKSALTMIVPYTVSTLSSISVYRDCNTE
ncbi:MAG: nitrate/nitrite transporter NrtS [Mariprofundaceae bacterium]|nr:nitrate/nitrite transporter NrtS [Mariprofundaceae bacterium]